MPPADPIGTLYGAADVAAALASACAGSAFGAGEVIDAPAALYPQTAALAQKLYEGSPAADGLVWMSRQHDSQRALLLWSGRVRARDLEQIGTGLPLGFGRDLTILADAAEAAGITLLFE